MIPLRRTKKISEAQYGYCREESRFVGSPYWGLDKTRGMHRQGTGHELELYVICSLSEATATGTVDSLDRLVLT